MRTIRADPQDHIIKFSKSKIEIKILNKMEQDPKERTLFEALEDLTGCPLPKKIDLETEWKPKKRIQAPEAFNVAPLYSTRFLAQI